MQGVPRGCSASLFSSPSCSPSNVLQQLVSPLWACPQLPSLSTQSAFHPQCFISPDCVEGQGIAQPSPREQQSTSSPCRETPQLLCSDYGSVRVRIVFSDWQTLSRVPSSVLKCWLLHKFWFRGLYLVGYHRDHYYRPSVRVRSSRALSLHAEDCKFILQIQNFR